jgi:hypothetical protein
MSGDTWMGMQPGTDHIRDGKKVGEFCLCRPPIPISSAGSCDRCGYEGATHRQAIQQKLASAGRQSVYEHGRAAGREEGYLMAAKAYAEGKEDGRGEVLTLLFDGPGPDPEHQWHMRAVYGPGERRHQAQREAG